MIGRCAFLRCDAIWVLWGCYLSSTLLLSPVTSFFAPSVLPPWSLMTAPYQHRPVMGQSYFNTERHRLSSSNWLFATKLESAVETIDINGTVLPDRSAPPSTTSVAAVPTLLTVEGLGDVILFDGVCNWCNAWVDILLRLDVRKRFRFAPLQSDVGRRLLVSIGKDADDISSVLLVRENLEFYDKSACVLKVVEELGPIGGALAGSTEMLVPEGVRDSVYDMVAENRYNLMGKRDECRCGDPEFADRFIS